MLPVNERIHEGNPTLLPLDSSQDRRVKIDALPTMIGVSTDDKALLRMQELQFSQRNLLDFERAIRPFVNDFAPAVEERICRFLSRSIFLQN